MSSGSTWARKTLATGASNSRVMRTIGRLGSTVISVSCVLVVTALLLSVRWGVVGHRTKDLVEAAVALLGLPAVPLDPLGHQIEHLRFEMDRATLRLASAAHEAGVLQ